MVRILCGKQNVSMYSYQQLNRSAIGGGRNRPCFLQATTGAFVINISIFKFFKTPRSCPSYSCHFVFDLPTIQNAFFSLVLDKIPGPFRSTAERILFKPT
jgi:hypothetical protein